MTRQIGVFTKRVFFSVNSATAVVIRLNAGFGAGVKKKDEKKSRPKRRRWTTTNAGFDLKSFS